MSQRSVLVSGIASERSLAAAVAQRLHQSDVRLLLTYQGEKQLKRVRQLTEGWQNCDVLQVDVSDENDLHVLQHFLREHDYVLSGLLHAIAFGRLTNTQGQPVAVIDSGKEQFSETMAISCHSLPALVRTCRPFLSAGAGIVTLSYIGAERAMPGYNVMGVAKAALEASVRYLASELGPDEGIRVNAVSAGPVRTLASSGVPGFKERLQRHAERSPLRRPITADEVAKAACFLMGDGASGITGQVIHVDAGYSIT